MLFVLRKFPQILQIHKDLLLQNVARQRFETKSEKMSCKMKSYTRERILYGELAVETSLVGRRRLCFTDLCK